MNNKPWQDRIDNNDSKDKGYCMIEAISKKGNEKFVNFYAVPNKMKEEALSDNSILMKSADAKNMYKVNLDKYNEDVEKHCKNAEDAFSLYVDYQNKKFASR